MQGFVQQPMAVALRLSRVLTTMFHCMLLQALEEKSNSLHEQRMHQLALERECSRLRLELERLRELQPVLHGELLCWFTETKCCTRYTSPCLLSLQQGVREDLYLDLQHHWHINSVL